MTGDESWFFYRYQSDAMSDGDRAAVVSRVSQTIGSKRVMIPICFPGARHMTLKYMPRG
jgi:hypothetical protein